MTDITLINPARRFADIVGGDGSHQKRDEDVRTLDLGIAVRQFAGKAPANLDRGAVIAKVTAVTDLLLALEQPHISDSASSRDLRRQFDDVNNELEDLFDVCFFGNHQGTPMTVTVTVDPENPTIRVHVLHINTEVDGGAVDIADRSLRLALQKQLNRLAA